MLTRRFSFFCRRVASRVLILAIPAALLVGGCSVNQAPRFKYGPEGEQIQFKRYEQHLAMDYIHHQTYQVYKRTEALPLGPTISETQKALLHDRGRPDYIRPDYYSDSNERVTDWVYFEEDLIYQFVEGEIVYEGPLSDMDELLIRRGRPSLTTIAENQTGNRADVLQYTRPFSDQLDEYMFKNGKLTGAQLN